MRAVSAMDSAESGLGFRSNPAMDNGTYTAAIIMAHLIQGPNAPFQPCSAALASVAPAKAPAPHSPKPEPLPRLAVSTTGSTW